jgi:signal transduction histidine kinase
MNQQLYALLSIPASIMTSDELFFMIDGYFRKHENYEDVKRSIIEVTQNVRDISHRMLPAQLEEIGLISTIRSMVNSINKSDTFSVKFDTNINSRLSKKVEVNIYYLIHELVNNATKHSSGNEIVIQLFNHTNALQLSVEDNGGSFKTDSSNFGLGLKNIKTRVKYLNGTLNIEADETETLFLIEIPI